jgi:hypothetical protein
LEAQKTWVPSITTISTLQKGVRLSHSKIDVDFVAIPELLPGSICNLANNINYIVVSAFDFKLIDVVVLMLG